MCVIDLVLGRHSARSVSFSFAHQRSQIRLVKAEVVGTADVKAVVVGTADVKAVVDVGTADVKAEVVGTADVKAVVDVGRADVTVVAAGRALVRADVSATLVRADVSGTTLVRAEVSGTTSATLGKDMEPKEGNPNLACDLRSTA